MSELKLKIVTPNRVFFDDEIEMLIARGVNGDFAILKNHAPFVTVLDIRKIKVKQNGEFRIAAIAGGYLIVRDNQIVIMSDACEWADEIDVNRAKLAMERAEKRLKSGAEKDTTKAEIALKKAINRLDVHDNK
ncbi:MAG: F0F1 ATP synthase subunit epsilon [Tissierellia bacterium]|nr:F0F1 ATP synthase subunit epsilon [Tissierellia bacterium]